MPESDGASGPGAEGREACRRLVNDHAERSIRLGLSRQSALHQRARPSARRYPRRRLGKWRLGADPGAGRTAGRPMKVAFALCALLVATPAVGAEPEEPTEPIAFAANLSADDE